MDEAERTDAAEDEQFGLGSKPALPPELADAKARQQQLQEALKELKAADAVRCAKGTDPTENPAQLPSTDQDSTTLPNKEGGYAPNYTPTTAVDTHRDFIVDAEVIPDANENTETAPMVDRVEEAFGQRPEAVLSDGLKATGPNIVALEQRGVEFLTPAGTPESAKGNPAVRDDPRQLEQTDQGGEATARGVRGLGVGCAGWKELGDLRAPFFAAPVRVANVFPSAKPLRSIAGPPDRWPATGV